MGPHPTELWKPGGHTQQHLGPCAGLTEGQYSSGHCGAQGSSSESAKVMLWYSKVTSRMPSVLEVR